MCFQSLPKDKDFLMFFFADFTVKVYDVELGTTTNGPLEGAKFLSPGPVSTSAVACVYGFDYKRRQQDNKAKLRPIKLYDVSIEQGRYFLHEHPKTASSWKEKCIQKLAGMEGVCTIEGPMCRWKMVSSDATGISFVKKQTKCLTNSPVLAEKLEGVCSNEIPGKGWHRHIHL